MVNRSIEAGGDARTAGLLAVAGALMMLAGAALWATTGTDIDVALVDETMADYLAAVSEHRATLVVNLCLWVVGAMALGGAGVLMANVGTGRETTRQLARLAYSAGVPLAVVAFLAWKALILQLGGATDPAEVAIAEVVGWFAYRLDGVATALLVGLGPALVGAAGRGDWVPKWLFSWGLAAAVAGLLSFVPYVVPAVPLGLSFAIVPIGIGWTLAAGTVLLRRT